MSKDSVNGKDFHKWFDYGISTMAREDLVDGKTFQIRIQNSIIGFTCNDDRGCGWWQRLSKNKQLEDLVEDSIDGRDFYKGN